VEDQEVCLNITVNELLLIKTQHNFLTINQVSLLGIIRHGEIYAALRVRERNGANPMAHF
jgi:hypothetical protein